MAKIKNHLNLNYPIAWILHESEASVGKALKGEVVVYYFERLITQHMGAPGSPSG
jgi:hypothetical protein